MGNNCQSQSKAKHSETRRGTIILSNGGLEDSPRSTLYKVLAIGESSVGKSSIVLRFSDNTFEETHISTIGVDFKQKDVSMGGKNYKLQIWDTAGQERYKTLSNTFYRQNLSNYRGVKAVLVVYDVSFRHSFEQVEKWVHEIHQNTSEDKVVKIVVGNKIDLPRQVSTKEGQEFANRVNALFIETSAKDNKNIDECFNKILKAVIDRGL